MNSCYASTTHTAFEHKVIPEIVVEFVVVVGTVRVYLEKYNVSQVDQLLQDVGLAVVTGSDSVQKEEFVNEVNKFAKLWPVEIAKQTKLVRRIISYRE